MSYILSALKKAEQERHSGDVPDLMTPQSSDDVALPAPFRWKTYYLIFGASVVALIFVVVVMWQRLDSDTGVAGGAPPLASSPEPPLRELAAQAPVTQMERSPASDVFAPAPTIAAAQRSPVRDGFDAAPRDFFAVTEPDAAPAADWEAVQGFDQTLDIDQLPPSLRKQLPPLKLTGHLYSLAHPNARKVILNGVALKEKQYLDDELMISEITPDGVILDFQGRLFRMGADHMFR